MSRSRSVGEDNSRSLRSGWGAMAWISISDGSAKPSAPANGSQQLSVRVLGTKYSVATFMPTSVGGKPQKGQHHIEAIDHGSLLTNGLSPVLNESRFAD